MEQQDGKREGNRAAKDTAALYTAGGGEIMLLSPSRSPAMWTPTPLIHFRSITAGLVSHACLASTLSLADFCRRARCFSSMASVALFARRTSRTTRSRWTISS